LLLIVPALWLLVRTTTDRSVRTGIAFVLGPILITLPLAFRQLAGGTFYDEVLLVAAIAVSAPL